MPPFPDLPQASCYKDYSRSSEKYIRPAAVWMELVMTTFTLLPMLLAA